MMEKEIVVENHTYTHTYILTQINIIKNGSIYIMLKKLSNEMKNYKKMMILRYNKKKVYEKIYCICHVRS